MVILALLLTHCTGDDRATRAETARSDSGRSDEPDSNTHDASAADPDTGAASAQTEAMAAPGTISAEATRTAFEELPVECRGFEVKGLKYSPGGSTLPNKCAPFDGLRNNPYAIRCIDADPEYKSEFPGDEYCILPPPSELGTQVHVAPQTPAEIETFVLVPGAEETRTYYINSTNQQDHYFYRTNIRMRPGAHHSVIGTREDDQKDGWAAEAMRPGDPAPDVSMASSIGSFDRSSVSSGDFGVTQRPNQDRPQGTLEVPPENVGLGALLKAKQQFSINLHYINLHDEPALREAWINVWYMDAEEVTQKMRGLVISGSPKDVEIPARQRTVLTYRCEIQSDTRIITMYGHRHAQTERFGVWIEKASGEKFTAYESFNWEDMPTYQYDSISTNPTPDVENKLDGASSGELKLVQGDAIYYVCDINNRLDVPLRFANETIDGEMCIVFGSFTGPEAPCRAMPERVYDQQ